MTGVIVLAASGVALIVLLVVTARRPAASVPERDEYFALYAPLHGGYDPRSGSALVRWWLGWMHRVARPLAQTGVSADAVTLLGVWAAGAVVVCADSHHRWPLLGVAAVKLAGVLDNVDGAVAVMTRRATALGYVVDSVADRFGDALLLVALWRLGAPVWSCVVAGSAVVLLEYTRARAGNAGLSEVGVVTVGERPTRFIVTAIGLLAAGIAPHRADDAGEVAALATAGVCVIAWLQLSIVVVRRLKDAPPPS